MCGSDLTAIASAIVFARGVEHCRVDGDGDVEEDHRTLGKHQRLTLELRTHRNNPET